MLKTISQDKMFDKKHINYQYFSDEELISLIIKKQVSAFECLYNRYFNKLVWFASGFTSDNSSAKDLVQEVFISLIDAPEKFNAEKKFSTWIYVVTTNKCKQYLRNNTNRKRILKQLGQENEIFTQKENLDTKQLKEKVTFIHESLSEKEQMIYKLRFEQELSIKEIATILNLPEGSVKSGIFYLLKKYTNHLKEFKYD